MYVPLGFLKVVYFSFPVWQQTNVTSCWFSLFIKTKEIINTSETSSTLAAPGSQATRGRLHCGVCLWSPSARTTTSRADILGWISAHLESPSFLCTCNCWSVSFTARPVGHPFRLGLFQRKSYSASRRKSSETSRPRSSTSGMNSTLVPAVQENYWKCAPTSKSACANLFYRKLPIFTEHITYKN